MARIVTQSRKFSRLSEIAGPLRPGRRVLSSISAGWTSVLLQTYEQPCSVEHYESAPSPDLLAVVVLKGAFEIQSFSAGSWKKALYRPGVGGLTAPSTTNRLRWSSKTAEKSLILRVYIPQQYFAEAHEEYRQAGEKSKAGGLDALSFSDALFSSVLISLGQEAARGAPDLYADAAARFLATHLLSRSNRWSEQKVSRNPGFELTDRRLLRVLEYMQQHCTDELTVDQLAREAGISRFHFSRLFKEKVGVTPHRHVVRLRMQHARDLLRETCLSIGEIAIDCGYRHQGHFAAAFHSEFGCTPITLRRPQMIRQK